MYVCICMYVKCNKNSVHISGLTRVSVCSGLVWNSVILQNRGIPTPELFPSWEKMYSFPRPICFLPFTNEDINMPNKLAKPSCPESSWGRGNYNPLPDGTHLHIGLIRTLWRWQKKSMVNTSSVAREGSAEAAEPN
jgi:hypothetical protein